jgi:predicted nucleic acid-binding protein
MPAVSNTSPISNLALIGRLDLLREQFGKILIPRAVERELQALSNP